MNPQAHETAHPLEGPHFEGLLHAEPESIDGDAEWKLYNLLSLDGGGIRGYWSLLVLQRLMECIAEKEEEEDDKTHSSFSPEDLPENVSQIPLTDDEKMQIHNANTTTAKCLAHPSTRRYLPCHYFDYICGSSTGALIAIMLGRFRMTVPDCIDEYKKLGKEVFGKPRIFFMLRFGLGNRTKYRATDLEKVFKDVTERRNERLAQAPRKILFPSERGLCRTFVTTLKTESNQKAVGTLYLIRSYNHNQRTTPNQSRRSTRRGTTHTNRSNTGQSGEISFGRHNDRRPMRAINYGTAQDFEIWEVARAATAAPLYFKPLRIKIPQSTKHMLFIDGGFNTSNNPTAEGTQEIVEAHGSDAIGVVVSVGTARGARGRSGPPIMQSLSEIAQNANDPEVIHREIGRVSVDRYSYYRLNDPGGLSVEMDEWEPKGSMFKDKPAGSETIRTITHAFDTWAGQRTNTRLFETCAAELVRRRRARTLNTAKWERHAIGARFTCRFRDCETEDFFNRQDFRSHLKRLHSLTSEDRLNEEETVCRSQWRYQPGEG